MHPMRIRSIVLVLAVSSALLGCDRTGSAWKQAESKGTVEAYEAFVSSHPNAGQVSVARLRIEELEWQQVAAANLLERYEEFLKKYPTSSHRDTALGGLEKLNLQQVRERDTIEAYEGYLAKYPDTECQGEFTNRIIELAWQQACRIDTRTSYSEFSTRYDGHELCEEARKRASQFVTIKGQLWGDRAELEHSLTNVLRWQGIVDYDKSGQSVVAYIAGVDFKGSPSQTVTVRRPMLKVGDAVYQLNCGPNTEFKGIASANGGHSIVLGDVYRVSARIPNDSSKGEYGDYKRLTVSAIEHVGHNDQGIDGMTVLWR